MTTSPPDGPDSSEEIPDFIPDDFVIDAALKEPTAEERATKAARIARENDRLRKAGQIADGSGKPVYRRASKLAPWVGIGAVVAIVIVVIALVAS
ncbi:MAG: hypothetical protein ACO3LZ_03680 [Candidatus Nanopelagicales bacterium]